jgi:tetratricopeptide (TPR) repeat protein
MARFEKLEFNEPRGRKSEPAPSAPKPSRPLEADWMAKAGEQRRTGFYEAALKYYSRALEQDRSQVDGWLGQVQMLVLLEEYPEAELWARKALELFPSHGDLMAGRAQALCRMKDSRRAYEACDGALKQAGQSAYRWIVRGEILLAGRQTTEQHCFDKAQQVDSDWLVPLEIALVYLYYGNPNKALMRARRAVELGSDRYYAWFIQGRCQEELGFGDQAARSFQSCLELCPGHLEARRRLENLRGSWFSPGRWLRGLFRR